MEGVTGGDDEGVVVIVSSRPRTRKLLLLSILLTLGGLVTVSNNTAMGLLAVAFFGCCAAVFAAELRWPARLRVEKDQMVLDHWGRHWTYRFAECGEFRVWPVGRQASVLFDYDGPSPMPRMARLNRAAHLPSGGLPPLDLPAPELAALLNERRRRSSA